MLHANAAGAQTITDERVWASISLQGRAGTTSAWKWAADSFLRSRDGAGTLDAIGLRGMLGRDLGGGSTLWAGYALGPSFPASGGTTIEHRVFQQYLWNGTGAGGAIAVRVRVEQRFIEANSGVAVRLRQQIRYSRPLAAGSRFAFVASDEIMFHANETTRYDRGLDQNRVFVGLSRALNGGVRVEAGYLNQFSHSRTGPDRVNHVLSVGASVAF